MVNKPFIFDGCPGFPPWNGQHEGLANRGCRNLADITRGRINVRFAERGEKRGGNRPAQLVGS
jgi:hypothetical protein